MLKNFKGEKMLKRRLISKSLLVLTTALLIQIFNTEVALAHAELKNSSVTEAEILTEIPDEIELSFSEEIKDNGEFYIIYQGKKNKIINYGSGNDVKLKIDEGKFGDGEYSLLYQIISKDGHLVNGSINFGVNIEKLEEKKGLTKYDIYKKINKLYQTLNWLLLITIIGLGLVIKKSLKFRYLIIALLTLNILILSYRYFLLGGLGLTISESKVSVISLVVGLINYKKILPPVLNIILFSSQGLFVGHSLALKEYRELATSLNLLHLASLSFWVGSIIALTINLAEEQLKRAQRYLPYALTLLLLSGSGLTFILNDGFDLNINSDWERNMAIKILLLLIALILGAYHHKVRKFKSRKSLIFEILVFQLILIMTSQLISSSPPSLSNQYQSTKREDVKIRREIVLSNGEKAIIDFYKNNISNSSYVFMITLEERIEEKKVSLKVLPEENPIIESDIFGDGFHFMSNVTIPYKGATKLYVEIKKDKFTTITGEMEVKL